MLKIGDKVKIISLDGIQQAANNGDIPDIFIGNEIYVDGIHETWGIYNAGSDWWIDFSDVELVEESTKNCTEDKVEDYSQVLREILRARKEGVSKEIATKIINILLES
jgi:hypothetical protein